MPASPLHDGREGSAEVEQGPSTAPPEAVPGGSRGVGGGEGAKEGDDGGRREKRTRLRPGAEGGSPGEQSRGEGSVELRLAMLGGNDAE